jgi:hypothetical protein
MSTRARDTADVVEDVNVALGSKADYPSGGSDGDALIKSGTSAAWGAVGKVLASKTVIKTDTQASSGIAAGASVAVSGLTISHAVQNSSNKVLLIAQINGIQEGTEQLSAALTAGGTAIGIGGSAGSRVRVGSSNTTGSNANFQSSVFLVAEYAPGFTSSVTYGVNIYNVRLITAVLYVNRSNNDSDATDNTRNASVLTLLEVAA